MPMNPAEIEKLIKESIPDAQITIEDLRGDGDHYAADWRFGIRQRLDTQWTAEFAVDYGLQVEAIQPFSFASR